MNETKKLDEEYIAHTYARFPVEICGGKGSVIFDREGREYIDLGSGIGVTAFGIADPVWQKAVTDQITKFQHTSNLYYSEPCAVLAKMLCEKTGMKKAFFSNSGAEANECAIKAARKYAAAKKGADTFTILTLMNSFHGRTITTLAANGQEAFHHDFLPLTPGFVYADANDTAAVEKIVSQEKIAAILFEVVQGEGGVNPLTTEFLVGLQKIADEKDILLIADEVQIGNGRSGALYGYMNFGIHPDLVTTAKGLGGGLPIGATLFGEKTASVYVPGDHGSTFGGNPVSCAGAISILSRLDETLFEKVREKSRYIFRELEGAKGIRSVSGLGLMIGIEPEKDAVSCIDALRERGVLILKAKNKLRLLPALNIGRKELEKAITIIKEVLAEGGKA